MAASKVVLRVLLIAGLAGAVSLFSPSNDTQGYAVPSGDGRLTRHGRLLSSAAQGGRAPSASPVHQEHAPSASGWLQEDAPYWTYLPLVLGNFTVDGSWDIELEEDFEGDFPGEKWIVEDRNEGYGEYYWGQRDCRAASGEYSGWVVGGGADGGALTCGANYPDHVYSWMKTKNPVDLSDATAAELRFQRWVNTPGEEDSLQYMASVDGHSYHGWKLFGGAPEWKETVFDLTDVPVLGNVTGKPAVWILFAFESNPANDLPEGAYVDDIVLRKWVPAENASQAP